MSKTLGGFLFTIDGDEYDYCYRESIISLAKCCDEVVVIILGEHPLEEGEIIKLQDIYPQIRYYEIGPNMFFDLKGKTKISIIQNLAAALLNTDYQLLVQADEVIDPGSHLALREAIQTDGEGFICERVNLWGDPNHMLVVPQERQPCSILVNRLTKRGYWCYDDGENISSPTTLDFANRIKIIHYGFVRKKEVMKAKIINMQEGVFAMNGHDPKLDQCEIFDSKLWFDGDDLAPIDFEHPPFMHKWVSDRM